MAYQQDKGTQKDLSDVNLLTLTTGVLPAKKTLWFCSCSLKFDFTTNFLLTKKILLFCSYPVKVVLTIPALLTENA